MKHFRVCNNDLNNWIEVKMRDQIDVVRFIKSHDMNTYEIEWKNPVTGGYATLIKVENGIKVFENDFFKIPRTFNKLK